MSDYAIESLQKALRQAEVDAAYWRGRAEALESMAVGRQQQQRMTPEQMKDVLGGLKEAAEKARADKPKAVEEPEPPAAPQQFLFHTESSDG